MMIFEQAHWAAAVFLVAALVLILRLRKQISEIDRRSYGLIVAGVGLLLAASVLQIGRDYLAREQASAFSPLLFVQIVWGIIGITGLSLVLIGVSNWMPLVRRHREFNNTRFGRLNLLRHLEQLLTIDHRLDSILGNTLESVIAQYGFSAGSVHKISARGRKVQLTATRGMTFEDETELLTLTFDEDAWLSCRARNSSLTITGFEGFPNTLGLPWKCLPVMVDERVVVVFLFWIDRPSTFTAEDEQIFLIIGDILGRKIASDRDSFAHVGAVSRLAWRNRLDQCFDGRRDLKENLRALAERLREHVPVEIISLTMIREDQTAARATIAANGASLVEARVDVGERTLTRRALGSDEPVLITDTTQKMTLAIEPAFGGGSARSLVAIPISLDGLACGTLVLASTEVERYKRADLEILNTVRPMLANLVRDWRRSERENQIIAAMDRIVTVTDRAIDESDVRIVIDDMAEILHGLLGNSAVRIFLINDDQQSAVSSTLFTSGDVRLALDGDKALDLALLPAHREQVTSASRIPGHRKVRIDDVESRQVYGGEVLEARIEPLLIHGRTTALVSVGFFDAAPPVNADVILSIVTRLLTIVMVASHKPGATRLSMSDKILRSKSSEFRMRSKMKSSLTGILGSVEILKSQESPDEANLDRYLAIIDRSAKRLQTYLEGAREGD